METIKTDIIVIAAGPAGLAAAISAAERGAKVVVFEKRSKTGETANMGMGLFGVESRLQKKKQLGPTRDEAFKALMDFNHWRSDARLIAAYLDKAATTIGWLEDMGVQFEDVSPYFPGGYATWHIVKAESGPTGSGGAAAMMKVMYEKAKSLGTVFYLKTPVKKIIKKDGKITGVYARDDKSEKEIRAEGKAVIIATGGFGSLGGIKINHRTGVLDNNWKKIPGLYAAGTDTCTIYGDSYPFFLPGNTMGYAVNTGRIAGENAADELQKSGAK